MNAVLSHAPLSPSLPEGHASLFGIPHLTRTANGYVFWKGKCVEHFSHNDTQRMYVAAEKLAARCRALESKGFPVNGRSAIGEMFQQAPADTLWKEALYRYYALFESDTHRAIILYRYDSHEVVIVQRVSDDEPVQMQRAESAYAAFHQLQDAGMRCVPSHEDFSQFERFLESSGLTPMDIRKALA